MKTAVIKITDEQTGESREFPILDDQGLVTFFTTFMRGSHERIPFTVSDETLNSLESQLEVIEEAEEYFWS